MQIPTKMHYNLTSALKSSIPRQFASYLTSRTHDNCQQKSPVKAPVQIVHARLRISPFWKPAALSVLRSGMLAQICSYQEKCLICQEKHLNNFNSSLITSQETVDSLLITACLEIITWFLI